MNFIGMAAQQLDLSPSARAPSGARQKTVSRPESRSKHVTVLVGKEAAMCGIMLSQPPVGV